MFRILDLVDESTSMAHYFLQHADGSLFFVTEEYVLISPVRVCARVGKYMCAFVYVCKHTCVYVCVCVYVYVFVCVFVCVSE
jgi:hypothetical protein